MANTSETVDCEGEDENSLKNLFAESLKLYDALETVKQPTNSIEIQIKIKNVINKFEQITKLVSLSGMFSRNEHIDEIPTESLQYLLLPALLGTLSLKLCNQPRREIVEVAEIYFRDFLQRCKDYSVTDIDIPQPKTDEDSKSDSAKKAKSEREGLMSMISHRDAKIKRYNEMKELKRKLSQLKTDMESENIDDGTKRDYFLTLLQSFINECIDELASIEFEKPMIEMMEKHARDGKTKMPEPKNKYPRQPLKAIIITKDQVQKAVYGLGYPSIPSMTIEEFYDNRVKEGIFPGSAATSNIPHATLANPDNAIVEDAEEVLKEKNIEEDNPEELERVRAMDEYKDDHRRGWGNRHNRS